MWLYGCVDVVVLYSSKVNISSLLRFINPGAGIIDGFVLQHTIFYRASPCFGGKVSIFVVIWPKTHVFIIIIWYYTLSKSISVHYQGSLTLGWESVRNFGSNLNILYQASPRFGGRLSVFVAMLAQDTCMYDFSLVLYSSNFHIN